MSEIRGALSGFYPLSESLITKIFDYKYGRDGIEPVQDLFESESKELIVLQENADFPILCSGSLGIQDLIRPFTRDLDCLKSYQTIGDLPIIRWHHTNTFYRRPTLIARFPKNSSIISEGQNPLTGKSTYFHEILYDKPSKIILPGPYSFASLIDIKTVDNRLDSIYSNFDELLIDIGRFLAQEIEKLPKNYTEIQLDEPFFIWKKPARNLYSSIIQAYNIINSTNKRTVKIVNTYFGDVIPVLSLLQRLPVSGLGIDFIATNPIHCIGQTFKEKILQVGIINAENFVPTKTGDLNQLKTKFYVHLINSFLELEPKEIIITSNTGLEYLPKLIADKLVLEISKIVKEVNR